MALIKKGHRKIAFIGTAYNAVSSVARENGFRRAMADSGIEINDEYIYKDTYDYHCGGEAFEKFWSLENKPTAIFAVSDLLAISAIHMAYEMGVQVGKDIAVMGFDNISMCEMVIPTVSTVEQPCKKMGEIVVAKLIENINAANKDNKRYIVEHKVILRESTGD